MNFYSKMERELSEKAVEKVDRARKQLEEGKGKKLDELYWSIIPG